MRSDYSDDTKNLMQMKLDGKTLTPEQEAQIIQGVANKNLDLVQPTSKTLNIPVTQGSGSSVDEAVRAGRNANYKSTPVQTNTNITPVSQAEKAKNDKLEKEYRQRVAKNEKAQSSKGVFAPEVKAKVNAVKKKAANKYGI